MQNKEEKEYYLGLDIGTDSAGWAVTDPEYHIIRKKGKSLWGVRLFDAANTAAERRKYRTNRRRLQRRKQRILLLQELFAKEMEKVDAGFFRESMTALIGRRIKKSRRSILCSAMKTLQTWIIIKNIRPSIISGTLWSAEKKNTICDFFIWRCII